MRSLESLDGYVIATSMVDLAETLVEAMNKLALVDRIAVDKLVAHMPAVSNSAWEDQHSPGSDKWMVLQVAGLDIDCDTE